MKFNITKDYIIDGSFEETFSKLDKIISASFYNSQFSTFGNFVSANPPAFLLMAKWARIGRPFLANITSTRIHAALFKVDDKSKISITTRSNPGILFMIIISFVISLIKLITYKTPGDLKLSGIYILVAIGFLLLDRFIKNIVIASFETDMNLKVKA